MRIIVLNKSLRTNVPDLNGVIRTASSDTGAIRMELHRVNRARMILESANASLARHIPQLNTTVISTGCDETGVRGELRRLDPVIVCVDGEHELAVVQLGHFQSLILGSRQDQRTIV